MTAVPAVPARRVLQPTGWVRAVGSMVVAVIVLSVVLQEPVAALLPPTTPRVLVFVAIALPVIVLIGGGLSVAYPRITVDASGVLRVRGRTVSPAELVSVRRSVSAGRGSAYLVLTFRTAAGRGIRVLVAGAPVRGLGADQLRVLRDAVSASAIPVRGDAASERAFLSESLLATGRRVEVDRELVLRELGQLLGEPHRGPAADGASSVETPEVAAPSEAVADADADDAAAALTLATQTGTSRLVRRLAFWLTVLACAGAAILLVVLVAMEATGAHLGAADEDPLTAAMSIAIAVALLAGLAWAVAADANDARTRALGLRWLATASDDARGRGLPAPFHAAWFRAPGGRTAGLGLLVLGVVAILAFVGGLVALTQGVAAPAVGTIVTAVGGLLGAGALWLWFARRRAYSLRVEWLLEVAGPRAGGGPASGGAPTR